MSKEPSSHNPNLVRLALPKGRMEKGVMELLSACGISVRGGERTYRPSISLENVEVKVLKPQNIVEMLDLGSRDIGFAGADWVSELEANLVELLDTELDPVRIVAAAPLALIENNQVGEKQTEFGKLLFSDLKRPLVVASEYAKLTQKWIAENQLNARFVKAYGATEVFPPEDADCIVDNTSTGSTLKANGLEIIDTLMTSSTKLYAHPGALDNPEKRALIERLVLVLRSVIEARHRVMVELNVSGEFVEQVIKVLPCMREPTLSELHDKGGFAVRAAVPRHLLPTLIPELKEKGGSDIVVTQISQIVA